MEGSGQLRAPSTLSPQKSPRVPMKRRTYGPGVGLNVLEDRKISCCYRTPDRSAHSPTPTRTMLQAPISIKPTFIKQIQVHVSHMTPHQVQYVLFKYQNCLVHFHSSPANCAVRNKTSCNVNMITCRHASFKFYLLKFSEI
jgi:hypothetical protein